MKKRIIYFALIMIAGSISLIASNGFLSKEKPVDKEISLAIAASNSYVSNAYKDALATVHVTVSKVIGKNESVVWEKTFETKQLNQYPTVSNAVVQRITVPNVLDNKEKLLIIYTVTYNTKGSIFEVSNGTIVSKGASANNFCIPI